MVVFAKLISTVRMFYPELAHAPSPHFLSEFLYIYAAYVAGVVYFLSICKAVVYTFITRVNSGNMRNTNCCN